MKKLLGVVVAIVALFLLGTHPAWAQAQKPMEFTVTVTGHGGVVSGSPSDHFISFSGPVEIPGVGLKPGTYVFQMVEPSIVRVLSQDRSTVYATFFTTPVRRGVASDKEQMTLEQTSADGPARIGAWYLANESDGVAPVYTREATTAAPEEIPVPQPIG